MFCRGNFVSNLLLLPRQQTPYSSLMKRYPTGLLINPNVHHKMPPCMPSSRLESSSGESPTVFWKPGTPLPSTLATDSNPFLTSLIPRPTAWISISVPGDDQDNEFKLALIEGFNLANDKPPTLIFGIESIPLEIFELMKKSKVCTLSVATIHQVEACKKACLLQKGEDKTCGESHSFDVLGLEPCTMETDSYPPGVSNSGIIMNCSLLDIMYLDQEDENKGVVILEVDKFLMKKEVLAKTSATKVKKAENGNGRKTLARIEANLVEPIGSLGDGRFAALDGPYHMYRPKRVQQEDGSTQWINCEFVDPPDSEYSELLGDDIEFVHSKEETCALGYNPTKQVVLPRPIGWISTFAPNSYLEHVAPYSFFIDVARGDRPMVAFVSMMRNRVERKDAQTDSEDTGVFAWNVVTKDLAEVMNYSSADLKSSESEFELIGMKSSSASIINAPIVQESPIVFECRHVKSKLAPTHAESDGKWTIVVGEVVGIKIDKSVLTDGRVDPTKLQPVSRLGYSQE